MNRTHPKHFVKYSSCSLLGYNLYLYATNIYNHLPFYPCFKETDIKDIDEYYLTIYKNHLSERLGAEVVNKCLNIVSNVFKFAQVNKIVNCNPTLSVKRKRLF